MKNLPPQKISQINGVTGEELSIGEFLQLCESVAVGLESLGVKPGDVVVLMGENTFRISAAAVASLFLAAPFGALDETLKPFELKNLLEFYKPKIIFCNKKQLNDVLLAVDALGLGSSFILLDQDEDEPNPRIKAFPSVVGKVGSFFVPKGVEDVDKEIALVIPSSGSTGLPKGVALSHRSIVLLAHGFANKSPFNQITSGLQFSHLYWFSGVLTLIMSCTGPTRIFLPVETIDNLLRAIKIYKPIFTFLPPPMVASVLSHPNFKPEDVTSLKIVVTAGAPLTEYVRDEFKKYLPNAMNIHAYGITETCGGVTKFYPSEDVTCVGQVETGVQVKIADMETGKTLPIGGKGEICLKSGTMFVGYLGNPEATKAAFDGDGWFRTGDLGRLNQDGVVFLEGRIKQLFKYRGHQISPEQIEKCLASMPGVEDSGVVGIPHEQDQYHTMALVVKNPQCTITEQDVKAYIKANMSESNHLHGGVKFVDAIPRTPAKKIRRIDLRQLALSVI